MTQRSDGTLIISPLRSEDSGIYTCTAASLQQLEQRQLQLRVQGDSNLLLPRLQTEPLMQEHLYGVIRVNLSSFIT